MPRAARASSARAHCATALAVVAWLTASPARAADCAAQPLPGFDTTGSAGWNHVPLSRLKRDTVYSTVSEDGQLVLQASAQGSASAWVHLGRRNVTATPLLEWRWRVPALIEGAANEDPKHEDSPARVIIGFDGDKSKLPEAEQRRMARAKALSGRDMPYAMLMYIWDNKNPVGTVVPSAHTSRVKMIVAESGSAGVGAWRTYRRDLGQDFQRAFGEKPQSVLGFALMTDTDNTGQSAQGFYGALRLTCASAK